MWEVLGFHMRPPCRVVFGCQAETKGILKECQLGQGMILPKQGGADCQEGHGKQCRKGEGFKNKNMTVKPEELPCVLFSTVLLSKI